MLGERGRDGEILVLAAGIVISLIKIIIMDKYIMHAIVACRRENGRSPRLTQLVASLIRLAYRLYIISVLDRFWPNSIQRYFIYFLISLRLSLSLATEQVKIQNGNGYRCLNRLYIGMLKSATNMNAKTKYIRVLIDITYIIILYFLSVHSSLFVCLVLHSAICISGTAAAVCIHVDSNGSSQ